MIKLLPNLITLIRIMLVFPIVIYLLAKEYTYAFGFLLLAAFSDLLDGLLARKIGTTRLGSILDPIADKILLLVTYLCLAYLGILPWWLTILVLGRDIILVLGAGVYHLTYGPYEFSPTFFSKINTFLQIVLLCLALFQQIFPVTFYFDYLVNLFVIFVAITTIGTCIQYIMLSLRRYWQPFDN